jgi:hypothetical protein
MNIVCGVHRDTAAYCDIAACLPTGGRGSSQQAHPRGQDAADHGVPTGSMTVSARETTVVDLTAHHSASGGYSNIATFLGSSRLGARARRQPPRARSRAFRAPTAIGHMVTSRWWNGAAPVPTTLTRSSSEQADSIHAARESRKPFAPNGRGRQQAWSFGSAVHLGQVAKQREPIPPAQRAALERSS